MIRTPTALYRLYGEGGVLLYVGITNDPARRFAEHWRDKDWGRFGETERIEIEWFQFRALAEDAEAVAIWEESPRYNIARSLPRVAAPCDRVGLQDLRSALERWAIS